MELKYFFICMRLPKFRLPEATKISSANRVKVYNVYKAYNG